MIKCDVPINEVPPCDTVMRVVVVVAHSITWLVAWVTNRQAVKGRIVICTSSRFTRSRHWNGTRTVQVHHTAQALLLLASVLIPCLILLLYMGHISNENHLSVQEIKYANSRSELCSKGR